MKLFKGEKGVTLLETVLGLALMAIVGVAFLSGLGTTTNARALAEERVTAKILAETQMESIKKQAYSDNYTPISLDGYTNYSANITIEDHYYNLQKITVTIYHHSDAVFSLESFKVKRWE